MASLWKGFLSFGLVNIAVRLNSAVRSRKNEIHFRQLHKTDHAPIKYDRVCSEDGESVPWKDIVKGYEYAKGKFVTLDADDLKAAALESSTSLEILNFVKSDEVDERFFETPYYLVPDKGGEKAYALLREAMRSTDMIGIGKFTLRQKQHLASIKAVDDALMLELMRFGEELVDPSEYSFPSAGQVRPQELQMAEQLIGNLAQPFDASNYTDDYHARLRRIIQAKLKGKEIEAEEPLVDSGTKVTDLLARLQESLEQAKKSGSGRTHANGKHTGTVRTRAHRATRTRKTA